jgi:hypothetical protein
VFPEFELFSIRCLQVNESSKINPIINAEPREIRAECLRDCILAINNIKECEKCPSCTDMILSASIEINEFHAS